MGMIQVRQVIAADNTDVLAGTQLDQVPLPGTFTIYGASTVLDSLVTVSLGQDTIINAQALPLRTNGEPSLNEDAPIALIESRGGVRPIINVDEQTAMSATFVVIYEN